MIKPAKAGFFMSRLFDTHCHLTETDYSDPQLRYQLPSTIEFLTVGTHPHDWQSIIQLSQSEVQVYGAIGLHPWFVDNEFEVNIELLSRMLDREDPISAIGEIGLDFSAKYRHTHNFQLQAFELQLVLATEHQLPVSIHCYKAHNEMLSLLKKIPCKGFMHGFTAGSQMAQEFIKLGLYIGVNGVILNKNARRYHQMVQEIGLSNLVLETDAPYGKNLPIGRPFDGLHQIAEMVSNLTGYSTDEVCAQTRYNAQKILERKGSATII